MPLHKAVLASVPISLLVRDGHAQDEVRGIALAEVQEHLVATLQHQLLVLQALP
eukprot:CAMPEP_0180686828 /NCGR_PEP_ID=MMETSP1037_2-20121125/73125_1 /TAXON_ID=632150 /ORGANISM="Azadinium spinosum, Strain 3D9" /LENGTH=53 /DNA_ID=CAMNT_0022717567 /DNA_START=99 /DNA_END=257 /DNA_ORIENTATION=+